MYNAQNKYFEQKRRDLADLLLETMHQLLEAEKKLAKDQAFTKQNPDFHSERFEHIKIKNSQILFFERFNNDIVIIAAGWSGRNWKERLEEMQPYIDRQIEKLKRSSNS